MIQDCDDPALAMEICASDEFEALELAIVHLERYIDSLLSSKAGQLCDMEGRPVEKTTGSLIGYYLKKAGDSKGPSPSSEK